MKKKLLSIILMVALSIAMAAPALALTVFSDSVAVHPGGEDEFELEVLEDGSINLVGDGYVAHIDNVDDVTAIALGHPENIRYLIVVPRTGATLTITLAESYVGQSFSTGSGIEYVLGDDGVYYMDFGWAGEPDETIEYTGKPWVFRIGRHFGALGMFSEGPVSFLYTTSPPEPPSSWAEAEVNAAIAAGLVPWELQGSYQSHITRENVAFMIINVLAITFDLKAEDDEEYAAVEAFFEGIQEKIDPNAFSDTDNWYVFAANALGIINGVGDGRFDPGGTLTRAQIAAIINRAARVMGIDTDGYSHSFADVAGHWADSELGWPVHAEIIRGVTDSEFDPDGYLTTEQAIIITYRAFLALV